MKQFTHEEVIASQIGRKEAATMIKRACEAIIEDVDRWFKLKEFALKHPNGFIIKEMDAINKINKVIPTKEDPEQY